MISYLPSTNALGLELIPANPKTDAAAIRILEAELFRNCVRLDVILDAVSAMNLSKFLGDTSSSLALAAQYSSKEIRKQLVAIITKFR